MEEEAAYWRSKYLGLQTEIRLREETAALRRQKRTRASTDPDIGADMDTGAVTERVIVKRLKTSSTGATITATDTPILSPSNRPFTLPADRTSRVSNIPAAPAAPTSRLPSASKVHPPATQVAADSTRATKPSTPTVPPSGMTSSSIAARRIKTEVPNPQDGQDDESVEDSNKIRDRKRRKSYFGVATRKNEDPVKHEDEDEEDETKDVLSGFIFGDDEATTCITNKLDALALDGVSPMRPERTSISDTAPISARLRPRRARQV